MNEDKMIFNLDFGKHSSVGNKKLANEDTVGYFLPQKSEDLFLRGQMFLIADGAGENQDGEFSGKLIIQTIFQEYFEEPWNGNLKAMLTNAFKKANKALYETNLKKGKRGYFVNSIVCAVIHKTTLYLISIGNCQAFLFSNNSLEKLTDIETANKGATYPFPSQVQDTQEGLLGLKDNIDITVDQRQIQINDFILLLTNSIYESVPQQDLPSIIQTSDLVQACELIVKMAIDKNVKDDASAIIAKIKSIRRLSIEEDEKPIDRVYEQDESDERQIVIKGVRYRSNRKDEQLRDPDQRDVNEFSNDRDFRHPVYKRTTPIFKSSKFSMGKLVNIAIIFLFLFLIVFAAIKYIPGYMKSLKETPSVQRISVTDSLDYSDSLKQQPLEQLEDSVVAPVEIPQTELEKDTTVVEVQKEIDVPIQVPLKIVIVDGSRKDNSLVDFVNDITTIYSADRITKVKSSFKIKSSILIWRRTYDAVKIEEIAERIEYLTKTFNRYFQIEPAVSPLDFTIVIGADFKMPKIIDNFMTSPDKKNDFYVEILNGFKVAGSARKLSNQLHNQRYNENKIVIVNYRNADKLNYLHSFIKCDASMVDKAENFADHFKLSKSITNAPLFDIKILIGSDI